MKRRNLITMILLAAFFTASAQQTPKWGGTEPQQAWDDASPWVYYYMMYGAISKEGFAADFEAMKNAGIGGAYVFSIRNTDRMPADIPEVEISPALSDAWWDKITYAVRKADSIDFKLGFHICDGFALAGGPWITPETSMQKVVWADVMAERGTGLLKLPVPDHYEEYYEDIATYAWPVNDRNTPFSARDWEVTLTTNSTSTDNDPSVLIRPGNTQRFTSDEDCWILYDFGVPFTCRSVEIVHAPFSYQAFRWNMSVSDDGVNFRPVTRLESPRFGWQNNEASSTYAVPETTARYFRMEWTWDGTEPGAEDIDAAKFVNGLSILQMNLSGEPKMNQFEGKSAAIWRVGANTTQEQVPDKLCLNPSEMIRLELDQDGCVNLADLPNRGTWRILRMGHTSTGMINETAGAAQGLECDKFTPEIVQLQFDNWFGMIYNRVGRDVAQRVIKFVHMDSWECGSQNWSKNFAEEFRKRRGYDLMPWLPLYAGVPIESPEKSDQVLLDIRETVSDLITDVFHEVFATNAHEYGCLLSTENVAPTQTSDAMLHFQKDDVTMGEFWLRSPTHDKPMDMFDAIHGGHIYGKNIIAAEAYTQLRIQWDEHPGLLKSLGDLHYAFGINRMVYHVYVHNPWLDYQPGMTLDGIGWYFQRDQTWWPQVKGWIDYAKRTQLMLQKGKPVVDVAVFTGEDIPRRAVLPDRLVPSLPGIFGPERIASERIRLLNEGQPTHDVFTVRSTKNFTPLRDWLDPLNGYTYDSFNKDVLLQSKAVDGRMVLPGGMSYRVVIFPLPYKLTMNDALFRSPEVEAKIAELRAGGVVVLTDGNGLPYTNTSFEKYGLDRDFIVSGDGSYDPEIAWCHRATETSDIYFLSNQEDVERRLTVSLRTPDKWPVIWDPVTGECTTVQCHTTAAGRAVMNVSIPANGSLFIEMRPEPDNVLSLQTGIREMFALEVPAWKVTFKGQQPQQQWKELKDWTENVNNEIKYYSGKAVYETEFDWDSPLTKPDWANRSTGLYYLDLGKVGVMAEVFVNGQSCGIAWTPPYRVNISDALKAGKNQLRVEVTNVWANALNGVKKGDISGEGVYHNSRHRYGGHLIPSGLLGPVTVMER